MSGLRVLITNTALSGRSGTETYVRDLATSLLTRGHHPVVYSTDLGEMARELEAATIPVVDDLNGVALAPDVIHGHHYPETLTALLHFPGVPAIQFCHDWLVWHDAALVFPRVRRYVAVDDTCRDRLIFRNGVPEPNVRVLLNAVDLDQFPQRGPLPTRPKRALVFSNYAAESSDLGTVRAACERAGIVLDVIGSASGRSCARPGELLGDYDLVFAKARCALEAMAVGTAVMLCDVNGCGPLVTESRFDQLRRLNFGRRTLRTPVRPDVLDSAIASYDPNDALAVCRRVRAEAGLPALVDALLALYQEVIEEQQRTGPADLAAEARAAADGLRRLMPYYREIRAYANRAQEAWAESQRLQAELVRANRAQEAWVECRRLQAEPVRQAKSIRSYIRRWTSLHRLIPFLARARSARATPPGQL